METDSSDVNTVEKTVKEDKMDEKTVEMTEDKMEIDEKTMKEMKNKRKAELLFGPRKRTQEEWEAWVKMNEAWRNELMEDEYGGGRY